MRLYENKINLISIGYALIVVVSFLIDFIIDKSGGAIILATLLIAFIAMCCFLISQFCEEILSKKLLINWLSGCILVLLGYLFFASKSEESAKEGQIIFAYAMLILAPPASFVFPLVPELIRGFNFIAAALYASTAWIVCVVFGLFQWRIIRWIIQNFKNSK